MHIWTDERKEKIKLAPFLYLHPSELDKSTKLRKGANMPTHYAIQWLLLTCESAQLAQNHLLLNRRKNGPLNCLFRVTIRNHMTWASVFSNQEGGDSLSHKLYESATPATSVLSPFILLHIFNSSLVRTVYYPLSCFRTESID